MVVVGFRHFVCLNKSVLIGGVVQFIRVCLQKVKDLK